jgi:hypothetical protein
VFLLLKFAVPDMQSAPKRNEKRELNAELVRVNSRISFIQAAFHGSAIDSLHLQELQCLDKLKTQVLRDLKQ